MVKALSVLLGTQFGLLTVLKENPPKVEKARNKREFLCQCSCPEKTIKAFLLQDLNSGKTTSCGCRKRENARKIRSE